MRVSDGCDMPWAVAAGKVVLTVSGPTGGAVLTEWRETSTSQRRKSHCTTKRLTIEAADSPPLGPKAAKSNAPAPVDEVALAAEAGVTIEGSLPSASSSVVLAIAIN